MGLKSLEDMNQRFAEPETEFARLGYWLALVSGERRTDRPQPGRSRARKSGDASRVSPAGKTRLGWYAPGRQVKGGTTC